MAPLIISGSVDLGFLGIETVCACDIRYVSHWSSSRRNTHKKRLHASDLVTLAQLVTTIL